MTTITTSVAPFTRRRLGAAIAALTIGSLTLGGVATAQAASEMPPIPEVDGPVAEGDGNDYTLKFSIGTTQSGAQYRGLEYFEDIVEGVTMREELDESTGRRQMIIIEECDEQNDRQQIKEAIVARGKDEQHQANGDGSSDGSEAPWSEERQWDHHLDQEGQARAPNEHRVGEVVGIPSA